MAIRLWMVVFYISHWTKLHECAIWRYTYIGTLIARFMGPTWTHLGPTGPRWALHWPHELCYQGNAENRTLLWCQLRCHWSYGILLLWQPTVLPQRTITTTPCTLSDDKVSMMTALVSWVKESVYNENKQIKRYGNGVTWPLFTHAP